MTLVVDMGVLNDIENELIQRGNEALSQIATVAYDLAPERTGELRGGIQVLKVFSRGSLWGEVGVVGVRHAPFQHFGTIFNEARPFLTQAFDRVAPRFVQGFSRLVGLKLSPATYSFAPGTKQYTYLQPGQAPPDALRNYLPVTSGSNVGPFVRT